MNNQKHMTLQVLSVINNQKTNKKFRKNTLNRKGEREKVVGIRKKIIKTTMEKDTEQHNETDESFDCRKSLPKSPNLLKPKNYSTLQKPQKNNLDFDFNTPRSSHQSKNSKRLTKGNKKSLYRSKATRDLQQSKASHQGSSLLIRDQIKAQDSAAEQVLTSNFITAKKYKFSDFSINRLKLIKDFPHHGLEGSHKCYKLMKAVNEADGGECIAKIYNKKFVRKTPKMNEKINQEIYIHSHLARLESRNVVKMLVNYETEEEIVLIFEDIKNFFSAAGGTLEARKRCLVDILIGLYELSLLDVMETGFSLQNIVLTEKDEKYKIFNFLSLSSFGEDSNGTIRTELTPPELDKLFGDLYPTSSSWMAGMLILKVFTGQFWKIEGENLDSGILEQIVRVFRTPIDAASLADSCLQFNWSNRLSLKNILKDKFFLKELLEISPELSKTVKKELELLVEDSVDDRRSFLYDSIDIRDPNLQAGEGRGSIKSNKLFTSNQYNQSGFSPKTKPKSIFQVKSKFKKYDYKEKMYRMQRKKGVEEKEKERREKKFKEEGKKKNEGGILQTIFGFLGCVSNDD